MSKAKEKKATKKSKKPVSDNAVPNPVGHPPSITPDKRAIFIAALENGLTITEALMHAEFSEDAYKRLKKKSAQFRTDIEVAKAKLTIKARSNISSSIGKGDVKTSQWWLERKVPDEFGKGDGDSPLSGLPAGTTIIVPAAGPHPRILPEENAKEED